MHLVTPSDDFFMLRIYSFLSVDLTSAHGCHALYDNMNIVVCSIFSTTTSKDAVAFRFVSVQKTFAVATVGIV